jgi:hypothetical protein
MFERDVEASSGFVEKVKKGGEVLSWSGKGGVGVRVPGRGEVLLGMFG